MSITSSMAPGKPNMPIRHTPTPQEGQYIRYRLGVQGRKLVDISRDLGLHGTNTRKVISGLRRSARIESEIARILGKADWNEVVLEARSEVQKKPVKVILREMEQEHQAGLEAKQKQDTIRTAEIGKRATENVRKGFAALDPKAQKRLGRKAVGLC